MAKVLKKVDVWYACINGGDGSVGLRWYLEAEHAEKAEEDQSEGWGECCVGSVETFEGSDIHQEAVENSEEIANKHEYLKRDEYYEARQVGTRAKSDKTCEHCGKKIKMGTPHEMHHFYPEFNAYPTHKECSEAFIESLN